MVPWTPVEDRGAAVATGLGLLHGTTYHSTIRVVDGGGRSVNVTSTGTAVFVAPISLSIAEDSVEYHSNCNQVRGWACVGLMWTADGLGCGMGWGMAGRVCGRMGRGCVPVRHAHSYEWALLPCT